MTRQGQLKRRASLRKACDVVPYVDASDLHDSLLDVLPDLAKESGTIEKLQVSLESIASTLCRSTYELGLRCRLLADLAADFSLSALSKLLNVPPSTFRYHLDHPNTIQHAPEPHLPRGRPTLPRLENVATSTDAQAHLLSWTLNNAPVKSGKLNFRTLRQASYRASHEA